MLQDKLGITLATISLASRPLGLCGGGHKYACVADSPHEVQHAGKYQRPQRSIIPLL